MVRKQKIFTDSEGRPLCQESVWRGFGHSGQCWNVAKHDNATRCGVHSAAAEAKRKARTDARYAAYLSKSDRKMRVTALKVKALLLVEVIAEGHNDPRAACQDLLAEFKDVIAG